MSRKFAEALKKMRMEKGLSQQQFADLIYVDRSTVASWETGRRVPNAVLLARICECLGVDVNIMMGLTAASGGTPLVMLVDDDKAVLSANMSVIRDSMPHAEIVGFTRPSEALAYAGEHRVSLAFLDIELGTEAGNMNGLELCRKLLSADSCINVVFLTEHRDYSLDAWDTGACGYILKPLTPDDVDRQLSRLRHPLWRNASERRPTKQNT